MSDDSASGYDRTFDLGDAVTVTFDTVVDTGREDDGRVQQVHPLIVRTSRAGGPLLHIQPDGTVSMESPNAGHVIEDFGKNAVVSLRE